MIQNSFLEKGKEKELEFALALCKAKSLSSSIIEEASKEDDIYRHIDIWVGANSFDVKAAKKTNRSDLLPNYDIHWIELRNVHGDKGWLFGQADYMVSLFLKLRLKNQKRYIREIKNDCIRFFL